MAGKNRIRTPESAAGHAHVRMYRHGLGDCFLLRFPKAGAEGFFSILIDCGLIGVAENPKPTMQKVVANISTLCDGHLDLVIMTHEHWDHASGFSTQQAQQDFDGIEIDEVWYAWTEDPTDALGKKLRKERAAKVDALQAAASALHKEGSAMGVERADRLERILQFFGVESHADFEQLALKGKSAVSGKTRSAFDYPGLRPGIKVRYCRPDQPPISLRGVDGVRVYVLGPPQDEGLIKRSSPTKKGKEVYEFSTDFSIDENLTSAFGRLGMDGAGQSGDDCPFEAGLEVRSTFGNTRKSPKLAALIDSTWSAPNSEWRQISLDWTATAETLALNLDSHTNNTCLVVAFELIESGRVFLFAADAQVGNWLSWQNVSWSVKDGNERRTVTGPELLERTTFYKVGHHGSHNATLRSLGLEQMTSEDLIAFVPVFKDQAMKNRWREMPFEPLVKRLNEKTRGRVVFSDTKKAVPAEVNLPDLSASQKKTFLNGLTVHDDYYEYSFPI